MELKERFSKRLTKNQLSEQAQNFYCHVLARICTYFDLQIRPVIERHGSKEEIDKLVFGLIESLHSDLCGTKVDQTADDIRGMLYFLTGNCHIAWAK